MDWTNCIPHEISVMPDPFGLIYLHHNVICFWGELEYHSKHLNMNLLVCAFFGLRSSLRDRCSLIIANMQCPCLFLRLSYKGFVCLCLATMAMWTSSDQVTEAVRNTDLVKERVRRRYIFRVNMPMHFPVLLTMISRNQFSTWPLLFSSISHKVPMQYGIKNSALFNR